MAWKAKMLSVTASLTALVVLVVVAPAQAATLTSVSYDPTAQTLTVDWTLNPGDCVNSVSISDSPAVDSAGYFAGTHDVYPPGDSGLCPGSNLSTTIALERHSVLLSGQHVLRTGAVLEPQQPSGRIRWGVRLERYPVHDFDPAIPTPAPAVIPPGDGDRQGGHRQDRQCWQGIRMRPAELPGHSSDRRRDRHHDAR